MPGKVDFPPNPRLGFLWPHIGNNQRDLVFANYIKIEPVKGMIGKSTLYLFSTSLTVSETQQQTDWTWEKPFPHHPTPRNTDPATCAVPAMFDTRKASWFFGVLDRFWLLCFPPVERMLRRWTSVALKNATVKGCLFCGPCLPIRPASLGLMLCP